jgi:hypothetical protein
VLAAAGDDADTLIVRITPLGSPVVLRETRSEQAVPEVSRTVKLPSRPKKPQKQKKRRKERSKREAPAAAKRPSAVKPASAKPAAAPARGAARSLRQRLGIDRLLAGFKRSPRPEATPLSSLYSLRLAGFGLMRFDGKRAVPGVRRWVIWFDDRGLPLHGGDGEDPAHALALGGSAEQSQLTCRMAGEAEFRPVEELPAELPIADGRSLELHPSPIPERYHALVQLSEERSYPLSPKALVLGRSSDNPGSRQPDLPLEALTHPESLEWYDGAAFAGSKLNAINLSRRHVSMKLGAKGLEVSMAEGTAPVYVLDRDRSLLRTLEPQRRTEVTLEAGQMILVGWYLLRFHRETARALSSAEHTISHRH